MCIDSLLLLGKYHSVFFPGPEICQFLVVGTKPGSLEVAISVTAELRYAVTTHGEQSLESFGTMLLPWSSADNLDFLLMVGDRGRVPRLCVCVGLSVCLCVCVCAFMCVHVFWLPRQMAREKGGMFVNLCEDMPEPHLY